jgi:glyoxalase/bleomycin resistance protein/dioxygenase superfamily protein
VICPAAADSPYHVGIATPDVAKLMAMLGPALGLTWVDLPRPPMVHYTPDGPVNPSSRIVYSAEGPLHTELLQAEDGTIYDPRRGTHLHHVGYWTRDLRTAIAACEAEGWRVEVTVPGDDGRPSTFAYLSRPGEPWIELCDVANREYLMELLGSGSQGNPPHLERWA